MKTQERLLVDARGTWKPYRVAYEVIRALRPLDAGLQGLSAHAVRHAADECGDWAGSGR